MRSVFYYSCVALLLGYATTSFAAGFRLSNQSAFATARGNAVAATVSDPSAVYYNPAGLANIESAEIELGLYFINFDVDAENEQGFHSNKYKIHVLPQLFYASPQEKFSWGFGIYAPFGLGNNWGNDTGFRTVALTSDIRYITASPVIAFNASDTLSLSVGATINHMDLEVTQGVTADENDNFGFTGDDLNIGWRVAAMWQPNSHSSFGATYQSAVDHRLTGESQVNANFIPTDLSNRQSELDLTIPSLLTLGYAYRFSDAWDVEFNIERGNWGVADQWTITNTAFENIGIPNGDVAVNLGWQNGYVYQVGTTYRQGNYDYSIGYNLNENVQIDTYYSPAVSDSDTHWLNFGLARKHQRHSWAAAYQFGYSDHRVTTSTATTAGQTANGLYKVRAHSLSFSYRLEL